MIIKTPGKGIKNWPLVLFLFVGALHASDHADSTAAANDPSANLLDLYAFVDPFCQAQAGVGCEEGPDGLTLALTLHPGATGATRFSSEVDYHFYIENDRGQDLQIDCSFSAEQVVSCAGLNGLAVQAPVGEIGVNGDIRVFAGLRDDPFFVDLEALQEFAQIGAAAFSPPGVDTLAGQNVLAIVLRIDVDAFPAGAEPDHNLLKVWAASERTGGDGINGAISGSWYNPEQSGQGWVIEVVGRPSGEIDYLSYFYGYDNNGEQLWFITGAATIDGNQVTADVYRPSATGFGGDYNRDSFILGDVVGSVTFEFETCDAGTVNFMSADAASLPDFSNDIERLSNIASLDCSLFSAGQVDRVGRPGIASLLISESMRNEYNTSSDPDTWYLAFGDEIENGLQALDSADLVMGNGFSDPATLAPVFADDRLQVDIRKGQTGDFYFSIETSALVPQDWNISGGRRLSEDVIDGTLAMLVSAWDPWVGDFVDANDAPLLDEFPYLAAPH